MTNEEAIQFLDNMKHEEAGRAIGKDVFYVELMWYHVDALNMAIKALEQEQKTGKWIYRKNPNLGKCMQEVRECSACGRVFCDHIEPYKNFCGFCGAKMEVDNG